MYMYCRLHKLASMQDSSDYSVYQSGGTRVEAQTHAYMYECCITVNSPSTLDH